MSRTTTDAPGTPQAPDAPQPAASRAVALLVAGTFFMENLDATVITPAIPQMAASFGVQPVALNVGVSAYMLTLGVFIPVSGWVADRVGARKVFASAIALFTLASLLCALAQSLPMFTLTRVLQGIGGAMMVPVGRLVVLRVTPKDQLIRAIATLTWPALLAPVLGPPIGGLIADHADWRWIFYLNLPLGVIAFLVSLGRVPATKNDTHRPFDWAGFVLCGVGLFCLLSVAELFGRADPDWSLASMLFVAGAVLLALAVRHLKRSAHPMIELGALRIPTFGVAMWGGSLFRMGVSAIPFLLPLLFQLGFGFSAFKAGAMLMAVFAGNLMIKPLTTPILQRFGFRRVLIGNGVLNALSISLCATVVKDMPLPLVCAILFVSGVTRSMQFTALNTVAFADVPSQSMTPANTLFSAAFQLAMGLGIALGAIAWHLGTLVTPQGGEASAPFRIAFLIVAFVSLVGVIDSTRLSRQAGAHLTKKKEAST